MIRGETKKDNDDDDSTKENVKKMDVVFAQLPTQLGYTWIAD